MKDIKGFTLIEILIVITIMGVLGFILTDLLTQVLRGQNKINIVNRVKQNAQVVLDKLSNEIRSAEKIICVGKNENNAVFLLDDSIVIFKSKNYTRFRFIPPNLSAPLPINGYITREDFTQNDFLPASDLCAERLARNPIDLTDKDNNGISIDYDLNKSIFKKDTDLTGSSPDLIYIRFKASESVAVKTAENTVTEGGILFTTAVSIRGGK